VNRPITVEGRQVWSLAMRLSGQLRMLSGMHVAAIGFDMSAALALAGAMQVDAAAVGWFLPEIEEVAVGAINSQIRNDNG
jgi:hypothetical protein